MSDIHEFKINFSSPADQQTPLNVLKVVQFTFYAISGLSAEISSLIIIITIIFNKCLHTKDFYLLAGLAGSDFIRGYGYLHGGIKRTVLVLSRNENTMVTPAACMKQIYQTFMLFGQQCSPLMVFNLSLDRFLAVAFFDKYRKFGVKYAIIMISVSYFICIDITLIAWITAFAVPPSDTVPITCKTETVTPLAYFTFHVATRCFPGLISMILYLTTLYLLKSKSINRSAMSDCEKKRESQLNKNIALISVNTVLFMTIPFGYTFFSYVSDAHLSKGFESVSPFFWSLSLFGAASNLFIYAWKYKKFRLVLLKNFNLCSAKVHNQPNAIYVSGHNEDHFRRQSMY